MKYSAFMLGIFGLTRGHDTGSLRANQREGPAIAYQEPRNPSQEGRGSSGTVRGNRPTVDQVEARDSNHTMQYPCILILEEYDNADQTSGEDWNCQLYGPDAAAAGGNPELMHATVAIEGMDLVLQGKPKLTSETTTLFAEGATFGDHVLKISAGNNVTLSDTEGKKAHRRLRKLPKTGTFTVFAMRITTTDGQLKVDRKGLSDMLFGSQGATNSFKSDVAMCSDGLVKIIPAPAAGEACVDDPNFVGLPFSSGGMFNCKSVREHPQYCAEWGDQKDREGTSGKTYNQACCGCGGGSNEQYNVAALADGLAVIDVSVNLSINTPYLQTAEAAEAEAVKILGFNPLDEYDFVMYMFPKNSAWAWAGRGAMGGRNTYYNGETGAIPFVVFHEVGHNWNLHHATENGVEYGDHSDVMGGTFSDAVCFNGAHSFQIEWYKDYNLEVDVSKGESFNGYLVGAGRIPVMGCDEYLAIKVNIAGGYPLYLIYNHAHAANEETKEFINMVTVSYEIPNQAGESGLPKTNTLGGITAGVPMKPYDGLVIEVKSYDTGANGYAEVQIHSGTPPTEKTKSRCR